MNSKKEPFSDIFRLDCFNNETNNDHKDNTFEFDQFEDAEDDLSCYHNSFFEVTQPQTTRASLNSVGTSYCLINEKEENLAATLCPPLSESAAPSAYVNQDDYQDMYECQRQSPPMSRGARLPITQPDTSTRAQMASQKFSYPACTPPVTGNVPLRQITDIPMKYRSIFRNYPHFNPIQSTVFEDVFNSDTSVVVTAPTGSGKTVIFELAIVRLLHRSRNLQGSSFKIVYLAPLKALCTERKNDWQNKFGNFHIDCLEITGDTDAADHSKINKATILLTTPEKWDSLTRVNNIAKSVKLFLIDEVHCLNDSERGATIEAVVSRMKTIKMVDDPESDPIRFLAVSATIPNPEDIAKWLSERETSGAFYKLNNDLRPVKLETHVLGYPCQANWGDFRFDIQLNYKLLSVIQQFSNGQPTLVFSPTRKSAQTTAEQLSNEVTFVKDDFHKTRLVSIAAGIDNSQLRALVVRGIAFHHAGINYRDRQVVENAFVAGDILVLVSTTTLAMGVNLPAHLVIIKSTFRYVNGNCVDYPETQILQMIGRAGRPQYDTSAVAVIMTKSQMENKFKKLITGEQTIESSLHKHLAEHLNVEIMLGTIKSFWVAMEWIKSTYLYVRVFKNPQYYDIDPQWSPERIENKIQEWCTKELNGLKRYELITMDEDGCKVNATAIGCLVSKYFIRLETVKKIASLKGHETLSDLLQLVASSEDLLAETTLRVLEKKHLNAMNSKDKNQPEKELIRFPLKGKIQKTAMKINCLIQAAFGCLDVQDQSLVLEMTKIVNTGIRVTKYMSEYLQLRAKSFTLLVNAIVLAKCFRARSWENTIYVARQFVGIAISAARGIALGGLTSLASIEQSDPGTIEMFANRKPPLGGQLHQNVKKLPKYCLRIEQLDGNELGETANLRVTVTLENFAYLSSLDQDIYNGFHIIIGNQSDMIIFKQRVSNSYLMGLQGQLFCNFLVERGRPEEKVTCHLISDNFVGIDVIEDFIPQYGPLQETSMGHLSRILQKPENWAHLCSPKCPCSEGVFSRKRTGESLSSTPNGKRCKTDPATSSAIPGRVTLNTETSGVSSYSGPLDLWVNVRKKAPPSATVSKPPPDNNEEDAELDRILSQMPSDLLFVNSNDGQEGSEEPQELPAAENGSGDGRHVNAEKFIHTSSQNHKSEMSAGKRGTAIARSGMVKKEEDDEFGLKLLHSMIN